MHKFLPLLLLLLASGKNDATSLIDVIRRIDFASFKPVLKLLGLSDKTLDFICSEEFSNLLDGKTDLKSLLPFLTSFLNSDDAETEKHENSAEFKEKDEQNSSVTRKNLLSPIENVAPTEIESSLGSYFS